MLRLREVYWNGRMWKTSRSIPLEILKIGAVERFYNSCRKPRRAATWVQDRQSSLVSTNGIVNH